MASCCCVGGGGGQCLGIRRKHPGLSLLDAVALVYNNRHATRAWLNGRIVWQQTLSVDLQYIWFSWQGGEVDVNVKSNTDWIII